MKCVILSKSDGSGGAAIVSFRLMEALRAEGVDARMLVAEKTSDSPFVETAFSSLRRNASFLSERLSIFARNGFRRDTLFKIDTGGGGLPLWRHPLVKEADAVIINWVNQGFLSLHGVAKIAAMGKKIIWTMHDMWNFTGICHHAHECTRYLANCGDCPLLGSKASPSDLSHSVWRLKEKVYAACNINFVAVSGWLLSRASRSSLLSSASLSLIPNPFPVPGPEIEEEIMQSHPSPRLIFGAARLDDPIKGFDILCDALAVFAERYPDLASSLTLTLYGSIRDKSLLSRIPVNYDFIGPVRGMEALKKLYLASDVVISTSLYENLPGTLIEGQAFGCVPVAISRGGQEDIISHLHTGWLAPWSDSPLLRSSDIADGIYWALRARPSLLRPMRDNVAARFSYPAVARAYLRLLH